MTEVASEEISVEARDGFQLAGTMFRAQDSRGRVVVVNSATGAPRHFYRHFAAALSEAGYTAVTYDYRGIGDSRPESLRGFEARMREWGLLDMAGMVDWAAGEVGAERIFLVGHSVGGQVAGMLDNPELVDGMVTFSAQSGYWRLQGGLQKLPVAFHVHVTLPLLSRLVGYMPWSWVGQGLDLPKGVALEWARWCRNPLYLLGDDSLPLDRYRQFRAPILAHSFTDDNWGTRRAVKAMMEAYPNVVELRHVNPRDKGLESIGHFGYFRPATSSLWRETFDWLDGQR
ncbi:MAG: alpha/beta fold hydrolase [Thermoanaerobaculia bacterium]|nr:alpha/beta fold hydrolase [Thermoanaerobaculia bacterium]